jgi:hypothetical protein
VDGTAEALQMVQGQKGDAVVNDEVKVVPRAFPARSLMVGAVGPPRRVTMY